MRLVLLAFLALCAFAAPAKAQYKIATSEDVLIAFFKTGNVKPNFTTIAKGSKDYILTPVARQEKFLTEETRRLQEAYARYNPADDLLTIKSRVHVELHVETLEDEKKNKTQKFSMTLSFGKDDSLFFPYTHGDYNIAIVPDKMDSSITQSLERAQYDLIKTAFNGKSGGNATLFIQLRPSKAYTDAPLQMGGLEQWALVADVAGLVMNDLNDARLWTYNAGWYVSPMTKELRDMYSDQALEKKQIMEQENPLKPVQ